MKKLILAFFILSFYANSFAQTCNYEGYFFTTDNNDISNNQLGIYPYFDKPFWHPNKSHVQGITNDGENWFISTTGHKVQNWNKWGKLWKIPKNIDLGSSNFDPNLVKSISLGEIPELDNNDLFHWGDPDHYNFNGTDYIIVPVDNQGPNGGIKKIACFESNSIDGLKFINFANITQTGMSWCAIDNNGYLFGPKSGDNGQIVQWKVNWESLTTTNNHDVLDSLQEHNLDFLGTEYDELYKMQGGEFSPSGELLYIVSGGGGECLGNGSGTSSASDGIHVFRTSDWIEIQSSFKYYANSSGSELKYNYFIFPFDNSNCDFPFSAEYVGPQGLTIWDLDDGSAYKTKGKLHVLTYDYNLNFDNPFNLYNHKISLHHFTNNLYLDSEQGILPPVVTLDLTDFPIGSERFPFRHFNDAYSYYSVWSGGQLILKSGEYDGSNNTGIYNKKIRISSIGGSAVIGQ